MCSDNSDRIGERGEAAVLVFHKVLPRFSYSSTNFSPRRLANLLRLLREQDCRFVTVDEAVGVPPRRSVAVTFDDGYLHVAEVVGDIARSFQLRPTVFIPTAFIGKDNTWDYSYMLQSLKHLDAGSMRMLAASGVEFGSHGHTHRPLTGLTAERLREELLTSKKILEDLLGKEISKISYPFGSVNSRVINAAMSAGYRHGFTMSFPTSHDTPLARGRYAVYGYDTTFTITQKITGGRLYWLERLKARVTNRMSQGTGLYRRLSGR